MEDQIQDTNNQDVSSAETTDTAQADTNTGEVAVQSASQSGEDNNAQAENDTMEAGQSDTVKQLLDERSQAKTLWQRQSETLQTQADNLRQHESQGIDTFRQFGITSVQLEVNQIKEDALWDKAYSKHPDLQQDSDLDQLVYANYAARKNAGEKVTPSQVADDVMKFLEKRTSKVKGEAYQQAENDITQKTLVSTKGSKRSTSRGGEADIPSLKQRARTGDSDALNELLDYI